MLLIRTRGLLLVCSSKLLAAILSLLSLLSRWLLNFARKSNTHFLIMRLQLSYYDTYQVKGDDYLKFIEIAGIQNHKSTQPRRLSFPKVCPKAECLDSLFGVFCRGR